MFNWITSIIAIFIMCWAYFLWNTWYEEGMVSHTNTCFIPLVLGITDVQTTSGPSTKAGPWVCLIYLRKLSQHLKFRRLMQKSAFQASKTNLVPLEPILLFGQYAGLPLLYGASVLGFAGLTWLFLLRSPTFPSISIWVSPIVL